MQAEFLEPLLSAGDARRADEHTMRSLAISGNELMERAGLRVAQQVEVLLANQKNLSPFSVVVICGPGNNGGDGWVVARRLWQNGIRAAVLSLVDPDALKNEAAIAAKQFLAAAQNELWTLPSLDDCAQVLTSPSQLLAVLEQLGPAMIVDAIFGTGLKKPAEGLIADVIDALNNYRAKLGPTLHVLSVDIPSGLTSDGQAWPHAHVRADSTIAIQFRKLSHLSGPHWRSCGDVSRVDIGITLNAAPTAQALLAENQPPLTLLRPPKPEYYKGHYGHVAVLYGSAGIQGASQLCAYSALRSGAGLATLLIPTGVKVETAVIPEIMQRVVASPLDSQVFERFTTFVVGTGVSESRFEVAHEILNWAHAHQRPMVVDAGALPLLNSLAPLHGERVGARGSIIATPHPGEAARLLKLRASDIEADRIKAAHALLQLSEPWEADVTWVLKGACPIVAHPVFGLIVVEGGVSTLSVGGSGDVLAGLCGALVAQTKSMFEAALLGSCTHLQSGRNLLSKQSRGFLAHEIADEIPRILFRK